MEGEGSGDTTDEFEFERFESLAAETDEELDPTIVKIFFRISAISCSLSCFCSSSFFAFAAASV